MKKKSGSAGVELSKIENRKSSSISSGNSFKSNTVLFTVRILRGLLLYNDLVYSITSSLWFVNN